jgi:protein-disulfide isomerase
MDKFSTEFLVQKEKIDFLIPYNEKVDAHQIPINQPIPNELTLETLESKIKDLEKMIFQTNYLAVKFPALNNSGILGTPEIRIQVLEDLLESYPGIKQIDKIYSAKFGEI